MAYDEATQKATQKARTWRKDHGRADGQDRDLLKAVREAGFGKDLLTNEQIIVLVGYADTGAGAVRKVRQWARDEQVGPFAPKPAEGEDKGEAAEATGEAANAGEEAGDLAPVA